jgi:spore cortex formation protein SpoVR/YcgB (stage V sporulation)
VQRKEVELEDDGNPYALGFAMMRDTERICTEPGSARGGRRDGTPELTPA